MSTSNLTEQQIRERDFAYTIRPEGNIGFVYSKGEHTLWSAEQMTSEELEEHWHFVENHSDYFDGYDDQDYEPEYPLAGGWAALAA